MYRCLALAAALVAACHPSPRRDSALVATPGAPEIADGFAQRLPHGSFDDYASAVFDSDAILVHRSATLSSQAIYGFGLTIGGKKPSWAIDRSPTGFAFVFDANGNGNLDDDPVHPLAGDGDTWEVTIAKHARSSQPVFRVRVSPKGVTLESVTVRWGKIAIGGAPIEFGVFGVWGRYYGDIAFDADGDGRVELANVAEFTPRRRMVDLRGACYQAIVDPDGDELRLAPRARGLEGNCLDPGDAI